MPSLSPNRPSVTVTIDKPRSVRFNWHSVVRFEEAYGKNLPLALAADNGPRVLTFLVWAGLIHAEEDLRLKTVEARINRFVENGGDIEQLAVEVMKALWESGVIGRPKKAVADDVEGDEGNAEAVPTESTPAE